MKTLFAATLLAAGTAAFLCGCNKTETTTPAGDTTGSPAAAPAAANETATSLPAALAESAKSAGTDLANNLVDQAKSAVDKQLAPIASELTSKVQALSAASGVTDAVKGKLNSTLESLISGQDASALGSVFEVAKLAEAAKFTPQQLGLAKEVGNLASAFVVQKNFATLEGAQGDVATLVKSLRSGDITAAIAPLKNVATNAHLTDSQKQLITSIADTYAPGWQKAAQTLDTLKKLPGFGN